MPYSTSGFQNPFGISLTPWVKRLLIANAAVWAVSFILGLSGYRDVVASAMAFTPAEALRKPWTILTYMFAHSGFFHFFFNMLGLFFFGPPLEERWGEREFIKFYLIAGLGGALLSVFTPQVPIVGASAAVYGVMLAYAMYWPDNQVYIYGIFPVKVKWLVLAIVALSVLGAMGSVGAGGGVAYLAHLGGLATAFLYLKSPWAPNPWGPTVPSRSRKEKGFSLPWQKPKAKPKPVARAAATPATPQNAPGATNQTRDERQLLDDVDRILEKISARGLGSLTEEERKRLDEVSRRYRSN